jgi:hypothetical protein
MASKTEETPQKEEMPEKAGPETQPDALSDAAIKKLIRSAKKRGPPGEELKDNPGKRRLASGR